MLQGPPKRIARRASLRLRHSDDRAVQVSFFRPRIQEDSIMDVPPGLSGVTR